MPGPRRLTGARDGRLRLGVGRGDPLARQRRLLDIDLCREFLSYARFVVDRRRLLRSENAPPLGDDSAVGRLGGVLRVQHRDFRGVVGGAIRGVVGAVGYLLWYGIRATLAREVSF